MVLRTNINFCEAWSHLVSFSSIVLGLVNKMFLDSHTSIGWLQGGQHATLNIILVTLPTWNYTMLYI